ncbi:metallophosphoesterase family protein [Paenibacillus sp. N3.4]|uniref:metallophosphoesterase family protein n=1 Tax=Paenibacillus sp. N3.4 TaxID=2603222 RepID=UPI0011CC3E23|nr:metallophosphoesterase family protein [Paenibacillus sp. N3.4]TXK84501.1 serine/threonine protein phosphatase [Paenibacillus sp. N3.4]
MKRTLAISDIHGCVEQLNHLLDVIAYNNDQDTLLLLGDYVDRGPASRETVEMVMYLVKEKGAIALKGNHDQRFIDILGDADPHMEMKFLEHGGIQTMRSYVESDQLDLKKAKELLRREYKYHIEFLDNLPLYYEDENHIYTHAGLNPTYRDWKSQPKRDFLWIREPFVQHPTVVTKTVVFGHTRTMDIQGHADVWFGGDKIGIDGGCPYGLQLNCLEIKEGNEYRTYAVPSTNTWQKSVR